MKTPLFFRPRVRRKIAKISQSVVCGIVCTGMFFTGPVMPLQAADFYWDQDTFAGNNVLTGGGLGGAGTWNTSALQWWNGSGISGSTLSIWDNLAFNNAIFRGTAGTVTLGAPIAVGGLRFDTTGFTINNGANTLTLVRQATRSRSIISRMQRNHRGGCYDHGGSCGFRNLTLSGGLAAVLPPILSR